MASFQNLMEVEWVEQESIIEKSKFLKRFQEIP